MFAIFMAFLAPILHSSCNLLDSHFANNLIKTKSAIIFYNSLTNVIAIPFLFLFGVPQAISWDLLPFLLLIAATETFYLLPYYLALRKIDASIASALFSLANILIPIMAWFLVDERLNFGQYFGFGVIIIASIVLNIERSSRLKINSSFWLMLAVSVMLAFQSVCYKYAIDNLDWVTAVFYTLVFSTIMSSSFLLFKCSRRNIVAAFPLYRRNFGYFLLNEVIYQCGEIPSLFALSMLPVVAIEGINATQPIFVLLFGALLYRFFGSRFKESFQPQHILKKLVCFGVIVWGVVLILR